MVVIDDLLSSSRGGYFRCDDCRTVWEVSTDTNKTLAPFVIAESRCSTCSNHSSNAERAPDQTQACRSVSRDPLARSQATCSSKPLAAQLLLVAVAFPDVGGNAENRATMAVMLSCPPRSFASDIRRVHAASGLRSRRKTSLI